MLLFLEGPIAGPDINSYKDTYKPIGVEIAANECRPGHMDIDEVLLGAAKDRIVRPTADFSRLSVIVLRCISNAACPDSIVDGCQSRRQSWLVACQRLICCVPQRLSVYGSFIQAKR